MSIFLFFPCDYQHCGLVNSLVIIILLFFVCLSVDDCGRNSFENHTSGYIFSPTYHPYYQGLKSCNWTISVPDGNIIKLRFLEFQLEEHPSCSKEYIEVYDGYAGEFKLLGRYCGQRFPSFLRSSSNVLKIMFIGKDQISLFKFNFSSEKGE